MNPSRTLLPLADDPVFLRWLAALETRHLARLRFPEVRKGVQALSRIYVQSRNSRLDAVLDGAGKRAGFAMFYAPLHFLLVRGILRTLLAGGPPVTEILDLGSGTGAAGAAWALETETDPQVTGIERHPWAASEARWSWSILGVQGRVRQSGLDRARFPEGRAGIVAAFTVNELDDDLRDRLRDRLLRARDGGSTVCVVEPVARRILPWWPDWESRFTNAGGETREWRFDVELPESLALMDRAAGLDHRTLTGRSLWLPGK